MKACALALSVMALVLCACDQQQPAAVASASASQISADVPFDDLAPTGAGLPDESQPQVAPEALQAYQQMEAQYMADPAAQWAVSATASSSQGEVAASQPLVFVERLVWRATGAADDRTWRNGQPDEGVDWLEVGFERAVQTDEIRVAMKGRAAVGAITRVDVIEEGGQYRTLWEGRSDVLPETRGDRTWFVRRFERTPFKVQGVKLIFANHAAPGYKEVDAVQLVGR